MHERIEIPPKIGQNIINLEGFDNLFENNTQFSNMSSSSGSNGINTHQRGEIKIKQEPPDPEFTQAEQVQTEVTQTVDENATNNGKKKKKEKRNKKSKKKHDENVECIDLVEYPCDSCDRTFTSAIKYKEHHFIQDNMWPFRCRY